MLVLAKPVPYEASSFKMLVLAKPVPYEASSDENGSHLYHNLLILNKFSPTRLFYRLKSRT